MAYAFDRVNSYIDRNKKEKDAEVQKEDALRRSTLAPAPSQNISRQDKSADLSPQFQNMPAATPPQQAVPGRARYSRAQANQAAAKAAKASAGSSLPGFIGNLGATATENKKILDAVKGSYLDQQRKASSARYSIPAQDVGEVVGGKGETPEEEQQRQEKKDRIRGVLQGRSGGPEDLKLPNIKRDIYGQDLSKKENVRRLLRQGRERYTPGMASLDLDVLSSVPEFTTAASKLSAQQDELLDYYNELSRELPSEASNIDAQIYNEAVTGEGGLTDRLRGRRTDLVGEQVAEAKSLSDLLKDLKTPSTGKGAEAQALINADLVKEHLTNWDRITSATREEIAQSMLSDGNKWLNHIKMKDPHSGEQTTLAQFLNDAELQFGQDFEVDLEAMADEEEMFTFNELNELLGPGDIDETAGKSRWKEIDGKKYYDMEEAYEEGVRGDIIDRSLLNKALKKSADKLTKEAYHKPDAIRLREIQSILGENPSDDNIVKAIQNLLDGNFPKPLQQKILYDLGTAAWGEGGHGGYGFVPVMVEMMESAWRDEERFKSTPWDQSLKYNKAMVKQVDDMYDMAKRMGLNQVVKAFERSEPVSEAMTWDWIGGSPHGSKGVYGPKGWSGKKWWKTVNMMVEDFNDMFDGRYRFRSPVGGDQIANIKPLKEEFRQLMGQMMLENLQHAGYGHPYGDNKKQPDGGHSGHDRNQIYSDIMGAPGGRAAKRGNQKLITEAANEYERHINDAAVADAARPKMRQMLARFINSGTHYRDDPALHGQIDALLKNIDPNMKSDLQQMESSMSSSEQDEYDYGRLLHDIIRHGYNYWGGWTAPPGYRDNIPKNR